MATAAPGLAALVIGGIITIAAVTKDVSRPLEAQIEEATGFTINEKTMRPPRSGRGEAPPEDGSASGTNGDESPTET